MKKILCIDGGGMCGLIPAYFLAELEKRAGKPIHEQFDMIFGTSIGSILALQTGMGVAAEELVHFFDYYGPRIFPPANLFRRFEDLEEPKYPAVGIEGVLAEVFGDAKMLDCKTKVGVVVLDATMGMPNIFTNFHPLTAPLLARLCARASSAAQVYFPGMNYNGNALWDGGNIANNPSVVAYASALELWGKNEEIKMLSLGCGDNGQADMSNLITPTPLAAAIKTVEMNVSNGGHLAHWVMKTILGLNYYRVQPTTPDLKLDGATEMDLQQLRLSAMQSVVTFKQVIEEWAHMSSTT